MRSFQRGAVRLHVLHHSAREPVHGTWLMAELQKHGHEVSPGTLYPILHSMEAHGLITSEHSVAEIGAAVGYHDPFYFSRQFREVNGQSPREFRRQARAEAITTPAPE